LGVIGNKEVASSLLDSLLDTTTDPKIKLTIAQALRNLKDESLTHRVLDDLRDQTIDWQVRWLLTESLEGLQESAKDSLMKILESQAIDEPVQVGIAATLGAWGVSETIRYLCNAIENKVVPPSWQQEYHTSCGYIWGRISRVLNSLGDESVVPILKQAFIQSPTIPDKWATINALLEYKDRREEIARQVLELARLPSYFSKGTLLVYMRSLATKSLVPELRTLLTQCSVYGIDEWGQIGIINGLAQVADDLETVEALQEMMPVMQTTENEYLRYAIYQALYRITQRARVRLRYDGQIEELQS
jgi:HEAT repeat protein